MRRAVEQQSPGWFKRTLYHGLQLAARLVGVLWFDLRCHGRQNLNSGPALVLSNHQSHFDAVLVGVVFNERLNYLARRSLFQNWLFAKFISMLDAIELDRDRSGLAGLKETLRRLKARQKVLVFPEGTRSFDGQIGPVRPGFLAVARRSQAPLIPLAINGAYEVLPRGRLIPRRYPLRLAIGREIPFDEYVELSDERAVELIQHRLRQCYLQAHGGISPARPAAASAAG